MVNFFRKIRRKLLGEGNVKRYFLYAVGEILLVMVGILLALYVSNNNEKRKQVAKSFEIMVEIKDNLQSNSSQFQQELTLEQKVISSIDIVLKNVEEIKVYNDTLDKHFHLCGFWPNSTWKTSGYEALKSNGVEIIEAKQLREAVIDLYEAEYPELSEIIRNSEGYSYSTLVPEFTGLWKFSASAVGQPLEEITAKPFSYEGVLQSKKLVGMLSFWRILRVIGVQQRLKAIEMNAAVIQLIDQELEQR